MNDEKRLTDYFIFYVAMLLFFGVGAITTLGLDWYTALAVPAWAPPQLSVAVIWSVLFIVAPLSLSVFWKSAPKDTAFRPTVMLYAGNAVGILLWNYLFFGLHNLVGATMIAFCIFLSVVVLMIRVGKVSRTSAQLLVPYLIWIVFAVYLNYTLMNMNP